MNNKNISLLINSAFSLIELIIKFRNENPDDFSGEEERIKELKRLTNSLESKPDDYLQTWTPK